MRLHEQYLSEYINTDFQTGTVRVGNSLSVLSYFLWIIKKVCSKSTHFLRNKTNPVLNTQLNRHILEMPTLATKTFAFASLLVYFASVQAYTFASPLLFFCFLCYGDTVPRSQQWHQEAQSMNEDKCQKTNSTSENTIQSSYFVLELRKLFFFKEVNLEIEIFHPRNPFHACCKFYSVY